MKKNNEPKQDITFTVKFEDGSTKKMTAEQIAEMREPRRYEVINGQNETIIKKSYRGI